MRFKPCINRVSLPANEAFQRLNVNQSISFSGDITPDSRGLKSEGEPTEPTPAETTCVFCKKDFPGVKLDKLSVYNICDSCKVNIHKKIMPVWVKLFFTGVLILVAFSVFWNWRFYLAYRDIKASHKAYAEKNFPQAAYLMTKASNEVPESKDVYLWASYYKGIDLSAKDKWTEALTCFDKCKDLPASYYVNDFVLQAEMGSGFDKKDYHLFLSAAKAYLQTDSTKAQSFADVASAYACLYAQNNADSLKQQSLKYLNMAKAKGDTSAGAKEFYGRISYRIDSRQVIGKTEFDNKFPNGYTSK